MTTALVHDWLTGMRGGEKVLEVLCERFPDAEVFTLLHVPGAVSRTIEQRQIHTSALQWLPGVQQYYRRCLPLFPSLIEQFDLSAFDLVISSSHCVAKSARVAAGALHVCYCHTPMRYAWDQFDAYFGAERLGGAASSFMRAAMTRFADWDRRTSDRVHRYLTNSQHVAGRIRRYYNREATVVYPPVDTDFFRPDFAPAEPYALIVSALVPYKRVELAIDASRLAGIPLKIVGSGPERGALERRSLGTNGPGVEFLGRIGDNEVRQLYRRASMFLMAGEEDFGIAPVEAQACGRPVVAYARGGALETVVHEETGILVEEQTPEAFADGMRRARTKTFDVEAIRRHAERFNRQRFGDEISTIIDEELHKAHGAGLKAQQGL